MGANPSRTPYGGHGAPPGDALVVRETKQAWAIQLPVEELQGMPWSHGPCPWGLAPRPMAPIGGGDTLSRGVAGEYGAYPPLFPRVYPPQDGPPYRGSRRNPREYY